MDVKCPNKKGAKDKPGYVRMMVCGPSAEVKAFREGI
jgi:hypothetical protein